MVSPKSGIYCLRCDYDLRGAPGTGQCPECGLPVCASQPLRFVETEWLRRLYWGFGIAVFALLLCEFTPYLLDRLTEALFGGEPLPIAGTTTFPPVPYALGDRLIVTTEHLWQACLLVGGVLVARGGTAASSNHYLQTRARPLKRSCMLGLTWLVVVLTMRLVHVHDVHHCRYPRAIADIGDAVFPNVVLLCLLAFGVRILVAMQRRRLFRLGRGVLILGLVWAGANLSMVMCRWILVFISPVMPQYPMVIEWLTESGDVVYHIRRDSNVSSFATTVPADALQPFTDYRLRLQGQRGQLDHWRSIRNKIETYTGWLRWWPELCILFLGTLGALVHMEACRGPGLRPRGPE